jgi:hypothetical protein
VTEPPPAEPRRPSPGAVLPWLLVGAALLAGIVLARMLERRLNGDDAS